MRHHDVFEFDSFAFAAVLSRPLDSEQESRIVLELLQPVQQNHDPIANHEKENTKQHDENECSGEIGIRSTFPGQPTEIA